MTVQTTGSVAMHKSPSMSAPVAGASAPGWKGGIIGGPASADGSTWWEVSSKDGLASWAVQEDLVQASAQASASAPTVTLSASPRLAVGMTAAASGTIYAAPTPTTGAPMIGSEASGNQGVVIGGPASNGLYNGRSPSTTTLPGGLIRAVSRPHRRMRRPSRSVRILRISSPRALLTLTWTSTNAILL